MGGAAFEPWRENSLSGELARATLAFDLHDGRLGKQASSVDGKR